MATITWRNLAAPQLQTNFQDNSLKGFSDLASGLVQQNQFAKEKEKADITENLKSSFFNYSGREGEEALGTLVSSGQFGEMMAGLGDKVDQNDVREALLGTQTRLGQENQRAQLQADRDRLMKQKPYIDAVDLLVSKGDLAGAKAYATGLSQNQAIDNDFAAKIFGSIGSAESAATDTSNRQALAKINLGKAQKAEQNDALLSRLMGEWEKVAKTETPATEFYGQDTPQFAAEASKRLNAINSEIAKTFNIPLVNGAIDTTKLSGPALDTYNKMYADQVSALQVPKPGASVSDKLQAFRQAVLDKGVPVDVVSQMDKTIQERLRLESPSAVGQDADAIEREKQRLATLKNRADAVSEATQRTLAKQGLSGNLISDIGGQEIVIKKLKDLGISTEAKDGDAQDVYRYVMSAIADGNYGDIDAKVVANIIDKVVAKRSGKWGIVNWDMGYGDDVKEELNKYLLTEQFKKHKTALSEAREKSFEVNNEYFNARMRAAQLPTK